MRVIDAAKPISVCFVIDRLSRAGTESQLLALLAHLNRDVIRPTLCLLNGADGESQSLCPRDCPVLDLRLEKLADPRVLPAATRLASFWRRNRVEIVQTYFLDSTYFALPLARMCGIPHVVRVRNNAGYWLTLRHRILGRVSGRLGITLTNSDEGRRALLEAERLTADRVMVIENGVDLSRFPSPQAPNTGAADVRIGAVANLRPVKNIDGLVRAAAAIRQEHPRATFEVAGEGPERFKLEQQISQAGLAGRFVLHGSLADVPRFLSGIDIAVLASHSESMSNALLEYMAAGRAIIATDVGANAQLIRHESEGLIVPPGEHTALADAIRRLIRSPELGRRYAAAARSRVETTFSREMMVRRFELFYTSLARTGRRIGVPVGAAA